MRTPAPQDLLYPGRPGDPRLGAWVKPLEGDSLPESSQKSVVLYGCPDDQGVRLNKGRPGASGGPDSIRRFLYKMTPPMDTKWETNLQLYDYGNIVPDADLSVTHQRAQQVATHIASKDITLIALGGGHDFGAPNFIGLAKGLNENKLSLINVDPHLDVREPEEGCNHSGTPFRVALESGLLSGQNFVEFGIRPNRNTRQHYQYCRDKGVSIRSFEALRRSSKSVTKAYADELNALQQRSEAIVATFDIDSCSDAEGTSAAPVLGFSAWELCEMAEAAGREAKVKLLELAEVAPSLDPTYRSSRIAAEMIYFFLVGRAALNT